MKKIIDEKNFTVSKIEKSDYDRFVEEIYRDTHPLKLVENTFPKRVMDIICSDHHKSKDGGFIISYDHWEDTWYFAHHGYVREVEAEGKTFIEAAEKYLYKIRRENEKVMYRGIEEEANKHLPKNISVEIAEECISVYDYSKGEDDLNCIASYDIKGRSVKEIVEKVNKVLSEKY